MKFVETYYVDGLPRLEHVEEAIRIARERHCVVEIVWYVQWNGWYRRYFREEDDPQEAYDKAIPHVYGM